MLCYLHRSSNWKQTVLDTPIMIQLHIFSIKSDLLILAEEIRPANIVCDE